MIQPLDPGRATKERFMDKVEFDTNGGCWLWNGALKDESGYPYGQFRFDEKTALAHRVSLAIFCAVDLKEVVSVCHTCDVSVCVNPDHLYCGSPSTNNKDTWSRSGRKRPTGASNPLAKLTDADVLKGRMDREGVHSFAKRCGVSWLTAKNALTGVSWRHVPLPGSIYDFVVDAEGAMTLVGEGDQ